MIDIILSWYLSNCLEEEKIMKEGEIMREEFKEKLGYVLIVVIGCLCIFALILRAEQIDKQKELSNPTQMEIR